MNKRDRQELLIWSLQAIADDAEQDAKNFDGKPFNGKTVAEYFGNHGASIRALALALKMVIEND